MKPRTLIFVIALAIVLVACSPKTSNEIEITEDWITLEDGIRLAADIYWPAGADQNDRFPVLLEYLPYRKDESRASNYSVYSYFLDHGYVVARVDIRGTGKSEGTTIPYEYSDIELDDGEEVIDWLARQGAICTSFYATTPVCSPSRGCLVSGRYPQNTPVVTNNIPLSDDVVTFSEVLRRKGYATGFVGKWHLMPIGKPDFKEHYPTSHGFDINIAGHAAGVVLVRD